MQIHFYIQQQKMFIKSDIFFNRTVIKPICATDKTKEIVNKHKTQPYKIH